MIQRSRVEFPSGTTWCVGYLHRRGAPGEPLPGVVLATGFGGTQDTPSIRAAAERFAQAGFAAFTFDYRNFGESGGAPRQLIRIGEQLDDLRAAVDWVRRDPAVRADRVALWGTSLGGGHVVEVAAGDSRIAAVIAQIPFNGFPRRVEGRSPRATLRLLTAMVVDALRGWLHLAPHYIRVVGTVGELAVMASPQAYETIAALDSEHWRNQVAPRVLFEMMRYKPGNRASQLTMPILVCIAERDREGPPETAREIADRAVRGEAQTYPLAHFDFYRPDLRVHILDDQVRFLRQHLTGGQAPG